MSTVTYEAAVYSRIVNYRNYKGEEKSAELFFALDPLELLEVVAGVQPKAAKRSNNPAKKNDDSALTNEEQLKFIRNLAARAAGFPSEDGETWEPYEDFGTTIAGKAFLTKLTASDDDRKEFSEKVIVDPFRSFVNFAEADPGNDEKDIAEFKRMLAQIENIFTVPDKSAETNEERRARLRAEMEALDSADDQNRVNGDLNQ